MEYPTAEDWVYLAGIVDGEGSIMIIRRSASGRRVTPFHHLRLTIGNTSGALANWMNRFGGRVQWRQQPQSVRPFWQWALDEDRAAKLIRRLGPHLVIKRAQAWLALEFQAQKSNLQSTYRAVPESELALREGFYLAMRELNRKGS